MVDGVHLVEYEEEKGPRSDLGNVVFGSWLHAWL